jgi:hypothetical protein
MQVCSQRDRMSVEVNLAAEEKAAATHRAHTLSTLLSRDRSEVRPLRHSPPFTARGTSPLGSYAHAPFIIQLFRALSSHSRTRIPLELMRRVDLRRLLILASTSPF